MTATTHLPQRLSPIHEALEHLHPAWGELGAMPIALHVGDAATEAKRAKHLALADASALARITLKGPGAKALLDEQGIKIPDRIFGAAPQGKGGVAARTGGSEFFIEDGPLDSAVAKIRAELATRPGVYPVHRADACFILSGSRASEVFEQTCGYNFRQPNPNQLIYTRVAGVSCSILPRSLNNTDVFQLWMDGTYGLYLWETLLEIIGELGGGPVGVGCFLPDISPASSHP